MSSKQKNRDPLTVPDKPEAAPVSAVSFLRESGELVIWQKTKGLDNPTVLRKRALAVETVAWRALTPVRGHKRPVSIRCPMWWLAPSKIPAASVVKYLANSKSEPFLVLRRAVSVCQNAGSYLVLTTVSERELIIARRLKSKLAETSPKLRMKIVTIRKITRK